MGELRTLRTYQFLRQSLLKSSKLPLLVPILTIALLTRHLLILPAIQLQITGKDTVPG